MLVTQDKDPKPEIITSSNASSQLDHEAIIEQIWNKLGGKYSHSEIRSQLIEVAPKYEGARIMTYVPIFLSRDVCARLQGRP